jgi:hypothetical protein
MKMAESVTPLTITRKGYLTLLSINSSNDLSLSNIVNGLIKRDSITRTTSSNGSSSRAWIAGPIINSILGLITVILVIYFTYQKQIKEK